MEKRKNIHLLPTDKPSRLVLDSINNNLFLTTTKSFPSDIMKFKNIYITSDEEIKFNDYITDGYKVWKWKDDSSLLGRKKVILSTDQDLIKDGVQAIDDEFLEWFVKNPSCTEIKVADYGNILFDDKVFHMYKIIIPKEEPKRTHYLDELPNINKDRLVKMWEATIPRVEPKREVFLMNAHGVLDTREPKQETLEEAAERLYPNRDDLHLKREFKNGAEWQAERMYSEEDMAESFMACWKANVPEGFECKLSFKEWFEQFKKKQQ